MSNISDGTDTCRISPVRPKSKLTSTPMRTRRKTSRRDHVTDVHSPICSTPTAGLSPRLQRSSQNSPRVPSVSFSSPSSSIPSSQENHPDVIWDFTSPVLPKGTRKKELKITVQELLENLNQCQSATQSAPYIKLLEKWMSKQTVETTVKKIENNKKEIKKRSRHRINELKKFIESIQKPPEELEQASNLRSHSDSVNKDSDDVLSNSNSSFKNSFLEGGSTDDSSEELWGDMDNSFIVKATQVLDKVIVSTNQMEEIVSTIPETMPSTSVPTHMSPTTESDKQSRNSYSELLLQLDNVDWDDDDDEWDNGFLLEDDDLSLIPEDILSGKCVTQEEEKENEPKISIHGQENTHERKSPSNITLNSSLPQTAFCLNETEFTAETSNVPIAELYNSFEDDSFEDESLLCQPEVLSRIDEVESMLSQPKCTPEEIKKKKDEALKRRKNKTPQLRRKT